LGFRPQHPSAGILPCLLPRTQSNVCRSINCAPRGSTREQPSWRFRTGEGKARRLARSMDWFASNRQKDRVRTASGGWREARAGKFLTWPWQLSRKPAAALSKSCYRLACISAYCVGALLWFNACGKDNWPKLRKRKRDLEIAARPILFVRDRCHGQEFKRVVTMIRLS
jgi:hypothetical protein